MTRRRLRWTRNSSGTTPTNFGANRPNQFVGKVSFCAPNGSIMGHDYLAPMRGSSVNTHLVGRRSSFSTSKLNGTILVTTSVGVPQTSSTFLKQFVLRLSCCCRACSRSVLPSLRILMLFRPCACASLIDGFFAKQACTCHGIRHGTLSVWYGNPCIGCFG